MTNQASKSSGPLADQLYDELLVVRSQQGDRRALERLFQRWNARLTRTARRYCGDADAATDLTQECWVAILKGIGGLRDPARFRSYAFSVLHRRGADYLRKTVRQREHLADLSQTVQASQPAPQSDSAAIAQAFATLPADQRLAVHLYFVEGLTLGEIAKVQSIPQGTAKSRIFHARQRLKAALDPNQPDPDHKGETS